MVSFGHNEITRCTDGNKDAILDNCRKVVNLLKDWLRYIRKLKVKKGVFLKKIWKSVKTN